MKHEDTEPWIRRTALGIVGVMLASSLGMLALIGWGAIELVTWVTSK